MRPRILPLVVRAGIVLLLGPAAAGLAQTPPPKPEPPPTLHDAWLREVLDLDIAGATAAYAKVAADHRPGNLDRWVATARLAEIQRLGVSIPMRADMRDAPPALREPLALMAQPLPVAELLQRAMAEPAQLWKTIGTEAGRLPPLRPVTPVAEEWRREQIPSLRGVRRAQASNRFRTDSTRIDRSNATDILRAELEGRPSQAEALRQILFADWQRTAVPGDAKPYLEKVRANLDAMLREAELSITQRNLLSQLRDAVNEKAANDPAAALSLVTRLPFYAERLLGIAPPTVR